MNGMRSVRLHWGRWVLAALLAIAGWPVFYLPVFRGRDVTWPSVLATGALLAAAILLVMQDARRRTFVWMAALAVPVFVVAVVVHNVEYALTGVEEPTFLLVAILGAPAMLITGVMGMVWAGLRDRRTPHSGHGPAAHPV